MEIDLKVNDHFMDYLLNFDCDVYFLLGGYGSSKSYNTALKINLLALQGKRKGLIVRQVKDTLSESCYADIEDIASDCGWHDYFRYRTSPMKITSKTGTEMIFRGLDKIKKIKSIKDIDFVWIEEADEINLNSFVELMKRLRTLKNKTHMFVTTNPSDMEVWTYHYLVKLLEKHGKTIDDLYNERQMIIENEVKLKSGKIYKERFFLHHSIYTDNHFLPDNFIVQLEQETDEFRKSVGTEGRYGSVGEIIFKNMIKSNIKTINERVMKLRNRYTGMDFGFSKSYNALVKMAIDYELNDLYIYSEFYMNGLTDPDMAQTDYMREIIENNEIVWADGAEPKAISFFNSQGVLMNGAEKPKDVTNDGVRKLQTFRYIYIDPEVCPNTWRELNAMRWYFDDQGIRVLNPQTKKPFNIDPHTFDAIKYGLGTYVPLNLNKVKVEKNERDELNEII